MIGWSLHSYQTLYNFLQCSKIPSQVTRNILVEKLQPFKGGVEISPCEHIDISINLN